MITLLLICLYGILLSAILGLKGLRNLSSPVGLPVGLPGDSPVAAGRGPTTRPEQITIIGASGGTGKALVSEGLRRGYRVTAFVRNPLRLGIEHPNLTIVKGDVLDPASLDRALSGSGAVVSALGHHRYYSFARIHTRGTANILREMEKAGVARFVCETSVGLGDTAGRGGLLYTLVVLPFVLPIYFLDKAGQEQVIAASNAEWTIVRPVGLTNKPASGKIRHGAGMGSIVKSCWISRADVAAFMLDQLESDEYIRRTPGVST